MQVGLGVDHRAGQHEDLVVETVDVSTCHDQLALVDAMARQALAGLEITLATTAPTEPSGPSATRGRSDRPPAPSAGDDLPLPWRPRYLRHSDDISSAISV